MNALAYMQIIGSNFVLIRIERREEKRNLTEEKKNKRKERKSLKILLDESKKTHREEKKKNLKVRRMFDNGNELEWMRNGMS